MDTAVWVRILSSGCGFFIYLGSKSSNPFTYLPLLKFALLIFPILVIQSQDSFKGPPMFPLCNFPLEVPSSCSMDFKSEIISITVTVIEDWISVSMDLSNFSLLWMDFTSIPWYDYWWKYLYILTVCVPSSFLDILLKSPCYTSSTQCHSRSWFRIHCPHAWCSSSARMDSLWNIYPVSSSPGSPILEVLGVFTCRARIFSSL